MIFKITYHEPEDFIEAVLNVDFNWQVMVQMAPALSKLVLEKKCYKILLDFRKINLDLSTLKMVQTPDRLRDEFKKYGVDILLLKRVFLISINDENHQFFETVMVNRGHTFRLFLDRDKAIEWLCHE